MKALVYQIYTNADDEIPPTVPVRVLFRVRKDECVMQERIKKWEDGSGPWVDKCYLGVSEIRDQVHVMEIVQTLQAMMRFDSHAEVL